MIPFQAMALLGDYTDKEDSSIRIGAIMGLGIAYAGSQNEQVSVVAVVLFCIQVATSFCKSQFMHGFFSYVTNWHL